MNDLHFVLNAADETSGVKSVEYAIIDAPSDAAQTFNASTDFSKMTWSPVTEDVVISADRNAVIYQKITDKAGNITYISSNGGFIVDKANPNEPVVTIKQEQKEVYNYPIQYQVMVRLLSLANSQMKKLKLEVFLEISRSMPARITATTLFFISLVRIMLEIKLKRI